MRQLIEGSDGGWWVYYTDAERALLSSLLGREITMLPTSYALRDFTAEKVQEITLNIGVHVELPNPHYMAVEGQRVKLATA